MTLGWWAGWRSIGDVLVARQVLGSGASLWGKGGATDFYPPHFHLMDPVSLQVTLALEPEWKRAHIRDYHAAYHAPRG